MQYLFMFQYTSPSKSEEILGSEKFWEKEETFYCGKGEKTSIVRKFPGFAQISSKWYIRIQSVPHRQHITSPLQKPTG
jgi:hypothetical protein